jgi:hypothetical protein
MTQNILKDKNHIVIGYIETDSTGKQTVKDKNHYIKGYYDPKADVTKDNNHNIVGPENLLKTLLS